MTVAILQPEGRCFPLLQRLNSHLHTKKTPPYIINLDPAVIQVPFPANIGKLHRCFLLVCTYFLVFSNLRYQRLILGGGEGGGGYGQFLSLLRGLCISTVPGFSPALTNQGGGSKKIKVILWFYLIKVTTSKRIYIQQKKEWCSTVLPLFS